MYSPAREAVTELVLSQLQVAVRQHFSGHALHHLRLEEIPQYLTDDLVWQLSTFLVAEDLSPPPRRVGLLKPMTFEYSFVIETPRSWWQMLKRDYLPQWVRNRWPVKYRKEHQRRKTQSWVRWSGTVDYQVQAVYPKFPEVYPKCGEPIILRNPAGFRPGEIIANCDAPISPIRRLRGHVDGGYEILADYPVQVVED
jgi:hypothetical protein